MLAVAAGVATAFAPVLGLTVVGVLAVFWALSMGRRIVPVFHGTLIVVCVGLAFFGRGFAYIGFRPIYISELAFVLAVVTILVSLPGARWRPIHLAMAVFMGWGLVRTLPYIGTYGIDALRDGVIFGYALFAFAVSMTVRADHIVRLLSLYRRWFPLFLIWVPIAALSAALLVDQLPFVPGSTVPVIVFKAGDSGVHLGAFGALMLLGLGGTGQAAIRDWVTWTLWFVALAMSSIISRGGMVAASMMATSILFARSSARWASWVLVGAFLVLVVSLANPQVDIGRGRTLSVEQAVANVASIVGLGQDETVLEVTKEWRLNWWNKIIGYTIEGPYFWIGKGFGDQPGRRRRVPGRSRRLAPRSAQRPSRPPRTRRRPDAGSLDPRPAHVLRHVAAGGGAGPGRRARLLGEGRRVGRRLLAGRPRQCHVRRLPRGADGRHLVLEHDRHSGSRSSRSSTTRSPRCLPIRSGVLSAQVRGRPSDREHEARVVVEVAAPQSSGFADQPIEPFEAAALHPAWRLWQRPRVDVEGGADTEQRAGARARPTCAAIQRSCFGRREADPHEVGAGVVDPRDERLVLLRRSAGRNGGE